MNKKVIKYLVLSVIFLAFCMQLISAGVSVKNYSISTQYAPDSTIIGQINLNLSNISSSAYLKTSFGDNIPLIELIKKQWGANNYSCSTTDCTTSYVTADSGTELKQFNLGAGESKIIGFVIEGISPTVTQESFSLDVTSNATESIVPQLFIDLLKDNSPEWSSYVPSGNFDANDYGCYQGGSETSTITSTPYCERIFFSIASRLKVGAYLTGSGTSTIQMSIQDANLSSPSGTCQEDISYTGGIDCIPKKADGKDYLIREAGNFFVCVRQTSGSGSYQIKRENTEPKCGFVGTYSPTIGYTIDYEIFGKEGRFAALGGFTLNDTSVGNAGYPKNLETDISNYLSNKYKNDCSNKCIVPIDFTAVQNQGINLDTLELTVTDPSYGVSGIDNHLYEIEERPASFYSAGYQNLSLNPANFSVPADFGVHEFELTLVDGENSYILFSKDINIAQIPKIVSVNPATTAGALPTDFIANVNTYGSNATINYNWNFGDGTPAQTTTTKTISHTYNQIGNFTMQISISNSQGLNSNAEFVIEVVSPREAVAKLLDENKVNLVQIEGKLGGYSGFTQNALKEALSFNSVKTKLQSLELSNSIAVTDEQYLNIMKELVQINLPKDIQGTLTALSAPFIPIKNNINLDVLKAVSGGDYEAGRENDYINSILAWELDNLQAIKINYREFSALYGESFIPLVNVVELNIEGVSNAYLIIPALENIYFDATYLQSGDYYYTFLPSSPQTARFATTNSLSPVTLPVFISPSLSELTIPDGKDAGNKILIFVIVLGSVIIVGMTAYILVGKWYQRKYESYLFKDRNDLYNIINYVHRLKNKGVKEREIEKSLRKAKWNSEQIKYVIKKYARKKIGIPGFTR